jgi:hypothetical protein
VSSNDLRGFAYPLEPALQRAQHRLDAALSHIAECQRESVLAQQAMDRMRCEYAEQSARLAPAAHSPVDPMRALASALRLERMQRALLAASETLDARQRLLCVARRDVERRRVELEVLETHRHAAEATHCNEVDRLQQRAADHDWVARLSWRSLFPR